ncbi:MAG: methylated-DNA--[protein]-cysteine S-methyltransferase [Bacteroidetes bacterium]|jgi:AraC family transcriptional regulator of adaptative response/methylated-DNA-[protein]-cysteine methyltransferase|nr:methylated-DNA--[protein]-cysteine S-methyltransferase [Bacteroidota bacterium]
MCKIIKEPGMSRNFYNIEKAVGYMGTHRQLHPSTEELAEVADLDVDHFRRMFAEWSGVDPETFSQLLRSQLQNQNGRNTPDLFHTAGSRRLSASPRHHNRFLNIIRMEPDEYQNGGEPLMITYSVQQTPFGRMMSASTGKGVCRISFLSEQQECINLLHDEFPEAEIRRGEMPEHVLLSGALQTPGLPESVVDLHVKGTPFQISVWESLLRIPEGELRCCSDVAKEIENPKALRAVGSTVGKNPIAFFIPCHRIVPSAGGFGNYRWGIKRKITMIGWEAVKSTEKSKTDDNHVSG